MVQPLPAKDEDLTELWNTNMRLKEEPRCLYCGAIADLVCVSGQGGYGQPKAYACIDFVGCLKRQPPKGG